MSVRMLEPPERGGVLKSYEDVPVNWKTLLVFVSG